MFRKLTRAEATFDIVAALVLAVADVMITYVPVIALRADQYQLADTALLVPLLSAIFVVALAMRRWSPGLALALVWAASLVQVGFLMTPVFTNIATFGVMYAAAAYGTTMVRRAGFVSVFVGATAITGYAVGVLIAEQIRFGGASQQSSWLIDIAALLVMAWLASAFGLGLSYTLGVLRRTRLAAIETARQASVAEALAAAEQERVRIARDMHDVVAHSLAVVIAQADGARYAATSKPELAAEALQTIGVTARSALADVRLLLTQLRHAQGEGPQPTLADLEELYVAVRATGVDLRVDVAPMPVVDPPAAVQLAVYRILQEALTNAMRHGSGRSIAVSLAWQPAEVTLRVRNNVADAASSAGGGHGLIGMRERAALVGGTLEAGREGADFVVSAQIPITVREEHTS